MNPIKILSEQINKCEACPLYSIPINSLEFVGEIPKPPIDLMVVAQNPSAEEHLLCASWFSRENRYAQSLLAPIFPSNKCYFTYLTKCSTAQTITRNNSETCRFNFLDKEISLLRPKIILFLGKGLFQIMLGKKAKNGDIVLGLNNGIDKYIYMAAWKAPSVIFNEGKKKEKQTIQFFKTLKNLLQ